MDEKLHETGNAGRVISGDTSFAMDTGLHIVEGDLIEANMDVMEWLMDQVEALFEVAPCCFVADDMELERY